MNNVIIKNSTGNYFVEGQGFVTPYLNAATRLSKEDAEALLKLSSRFGFSASGETVPDKSFAVCYVRGVDRNADGTVKANVLNPSRRRFATEDEARIHGARFHVRKASFGAAPGSAGHIGFYVIETSDPVNSKVNPATGLTNPANGAPRTYAERQAAKNAAASRS